MELEEVELSRILNIAKVDLNKKVSDWTDSESKINHSSYF